MDGSPAPSSVWSRGGTKSEASAGACASEGFGVECGLPRADRSDDDDVRWTSITITEAVAVRGARTQRRPPCLKSRRHAVHMRK